MAYSLLGGTIAFTVAGQLLVNAGMSEVGTMPRGSQPLPGFFFAALLNFRVVAGLLFALLPALTWMAAVSVIDISLAYPFMVLAVVEVLALSSVLLEELKPLHGWLRVLIVCLGLVLAARG